MIRGPSCTAVISLISHCCFSIALLLGQVLEAGKKSKTRPIDVTPVRHHFIHHHRDHDQLIMILEYCFLFADSYVLLVWVSNNTSDVFALPCQT